MSGNPFRVVTNDPALDETAEQHSAALAFIERVKVRKQARWHNVPMPEFERLCRAYGIDPPARAK